MTKTGLTEHVVRQGGAAVTSLRALIVERKATDALAPVTVIVPTKVTGLALRRTLAASIGGLVGVRVLVLAQLAELLAARALARGGRTPLTDQLRREHVRLALAAVPGALRGVAGHPATERLVDRAVVELRRATAAGDEDAVLAELDAGAALPRTFAGIYRALRARVEPMHYDEEDLTIAAVEVLERDPSAGREVGAVILFLPQGDRACRETPLLQEVNPAGDRLVRALAQQLPVDVLLCSADPDPDPGADATPHAALSAPDADEEVRGVVREIARLLRAGEPLHRMAVLYGDPEPYATLAAEHLAAADLPANGPVARTLGQTIPGRVLSGLLALPEEGYARQAVLDWLALGPLRTAAGPVPAERWSGIAEAADIGRGREQWGQRLRALMGRDGVSRDDRTAARSLLAFLDEVVGQLDGPAEQTWARFGRWAAGLLDRSLGVARDGWPVQDRRAETALRERLAALATLDVAAAPAAVDLAAFRRALRAELDEPAGRIGSFGVGVYLGPVATATALDFDHVFVLGMAEGAFPTRPLEQPLLPDEIRHRLRELLPESPAAAALPTRDERVAQERAALLAVISSGARTTLCHPRADRRRQRERVPSPWFLELVKRECRSIPSTSAGIEQAEEPATRAEWVARELLRSVHRGDDVTETPLVVADRALARGITVTRLRASDSFTAWDGLVGEHPFLAERLARPHSPTALGRYGTCPRQYLLSEVLGIRERQDREDPLALEGAHRGRTLHSILERFLHALADENPADTEDRRALLRRLADDALAEIAGKGVSDRLRWRLSADSVRIWLDRWLGEHEALAAELGAAPVGAELAFGEAGDPLGRVTVRLPDGRELALRGRIDRLDASPDSDLVLVVDYKTASDERYRGVEEDPVLGGRELQLAVYALAARQAYPEADVQARYWFLGPRTTKLGQRGFSFDEAARRRTLHVLDDLATGIGSGMFPVRPGTWDDYRRTYENCRSCAFDRVCPAPQERERAGLS